MGALATLRPGIGQAELTAAASLVAPLTGVGIRSPWQATPSHLEHIVWSDVFGALAPTPLTRAEAMRVPAVARSRHVIAGTLARIPLRAYRGESTDPLPLAEVPWIASTAGSMSPFHRMLMTADDLLFYGWSLWRRTRNDAAGRFPLQMDRIPIGEWQLEPDTLRVLIYKTDPVHPGSVSLQPARVDEVVLIPGPHEGLLVDGANSVRHAIDLQRAAHNAAKHPSAYLGLKQTTGTPLKRRSTDPDEVTVETILTEWREARNRPEGGGVAWLGGVEPHEFGTFDAHLLTDGRNAAAVDVARHASLPADVIDATVAQASLQYTTSRDNDRRLIDYGLGLYMGAISGALTQDAVTAAGQRVAFDLEEWLAGDAAVPGQPATTAAPGMTPGAVPTTGEPPQ